jgi:putative transposase
MSQTARLAMVSRPHADFSIARQCALLKVPRSTLYYKPKPVSDDDLTLMRRIDEIYMKWPFYGSRKMVAELRGEHRDVNRKRVRRLMRLMGIEAIYQKPNTSRKHSAHKIYPYLLKNLDIDHANHVWCSDITSIPMARGFVYLVAVMDWFSRRVLAWRLSITLEGDFCFDALQEAMDRYGKPKIFNTDQGSQFTAEAFTALLEASGVQVSMDGKGRFLDNIFIERLWRSLKYEDIFIKAYGSVAEARLGIQAWMRFYNDERKHQALGYRTPHEIFAASIAYVGVDGPTASNVPIWVDIIKPMKGPPKWSIDGFQSIRPSMCSPSMGSINRNIRSCGAT